MSCVPYYLYQPSYCYEQYCCEPKCESRCGPPGPPGPPAPTSNAYIGAVSGSLTTGTAYTPIATTMTLSVGTQQQITSFTTSFLAPNPDYVVNQAAGTITILTNGYYDIKLSANIQSSTAGINYFFIASTTANPPTSVILSSYGDTATAATGANYNAEAIVYLPAGTTLYTFVGYSVAIGGTFSVTGNWLSILIRKVA